LSHVISNLAKVKKKILQSNANVVTSRYIKWLRGDSQVKGKKSEEGRK